MNLGGEVLFIFEVDLYDVNEFEKTQIDSD